MQKGFNSDVNFRGQAYHIQTEDWGLQNPFIVTRIFKQGSVIKTVKKTYLEALADKRLSAENIQLALRLQHNEMLDQLIGGRLV
jgi:hypothetical protein